MSPLATSITPRWNSALRRRSSGSCIITGASLNSQRLWLEPLIHGTRQLYPFPARNPTTMMDPALGHHVVGSSLLRHREVWRSGTNSPWSQPPSSSTLKQSVISRISSPIHQTGVRLPAPSILPSQSGISKRVELSKELHVTPNVSRWRGHRMDRRFVLSRKGTG